MDGFFTPNPLFLALILLKTTAYLTLLLTLAVLRAGFARGASRWAAVGATMLALLGLWAQHGPSVLGVTSGDWVAWAQTYKGALSGFAPLILASLALGASALLPGRRWWGIDAVHIVLFGATLMLWGITL